MWKRSTSGVTRPSVNSPAWRLTRTSGYSGCRNLIIRIWSEIADRGGIVPAGTGFEPDEPRFEHRKLETLEDLSKH